MFFCRFMRRLPSGDFLTLGVFVLPLSEADQRSHHEGEHEDWEPSRQHEEEPCASDHSV